MPAGISFTLAEKFLLKFFIDENAVPKAFKFSGLTGMVQKIFGSSGFNGVWIVHVFLDQPQNLLNISGDAVLRINRPVVQK